MPTSSNEMVAQKLREMAELLELQQADAYRVSAYRKAAAVVANLNQAIEELVRERGLRGVIELPGIGRSIGSAIVEMITSGHWGQLERLAGSLEPDLLFQSIPGLGPALAARIHHELDVDTLEQLELAAHDGRLERVPGVGQRRAQTVRAALEDRLGHRHIRVRASQGRLPVDILLDVDREYREKASRNALRMIAPKRFNPSGIAWLPVLHTARNNWLLTALYSNTKRAHDLAKTDDWVVIYFHAEDGPEAQATVVTENRGPLAGYRVVRGRESECIEFYSTSVKDVRRDDGNGRRSNGSG